jgi:hypothetical protein
MYHLSFEGCIKLKMIDEEISGLKSLRNLNLRGCREFDTLPTSLVELDLHILDLSGTKCPANQSSQQVIQALVLRNEQNLVRIPGEEPVQKCFKFVISKDLASSILQHLMNP